MKRKIEPLVLPVALNRQGVDGAYILLQGTKIADIPAALADLKPAGIDIDEADRAPVSGDHVARWINQDWVASIVRYEQPYRTQRGLRPRHSIWAAPGVRAK